MATLKQAVRGAIHEAAQKYRQHVRDREEKEKLERHNKTLGTHVTWQQFTRARKMTLCNMDEFFHFAFYDKTDAQRDEYLTVERQDAFAASVGDVFRPLTIPGNKVLFNCLFGEFLQREWLNPSDCPAEAFLAFAARHGQIMVKPPDQCKGIGIYKFRHESDEATLALYRQLRGSGALVEEVLKQHPQMDKINPNLINTVRMSTYTDTDQVHILAAAMRTSARADKCTDNLHGGGCACALDAETGVIVSDAFDSQMHTYPAHPLTGTRFKGFQVPMWDEALAIVRAAARRAYALPQCHWIGWDLAFLPDRVALIEGNWRQAVDLIQYGQKGLYHQLTQLGKKL